MKADLKGALAKLNTSWKAFEHNGKPMTKIEIEKALRYGIRKGYKDTSQLTNADIETAISEPLPMKALSLLQPWASLVVLGHKTIETRSWDTPYRGWILIHASKGKISYTAYKEMTWKYIEHLQLDAIKEHGPKLMEPVFGAIIGIAEIVETFNTDNYRNKKGEHFTAFGNADGISAREETFGDYSPGRFGWLLKNAIAFANPIPCKGMLGLWTPDAETIAKVIEQIPKITRERMLFSGTWNLKGGK